MSKGPGFTRDRVLALADAGFKHRESQVQTKPAPPAPPEPAAADPGPPPEQHPVPTKAEILGKRKRNTGLRSDPGWAPFGLFLEIEVRAEAKALADAMGLDFSEYVNACIKVQNDPESRHSYLAGLLNS